VILVGVQTRLPKGEWRVKVHVTFLMQMKPFVLHCGKELTYISPLWEAVSKVDGLVKLAEGGNLDSPAFRLLT
jgi:hypothetical protein